MTAEIPPKENYDILLRAGILAAFRLGFLEAAAEAFKLVIDERWEEIPDSQTAGLIQFVEGHEAIYTDNYGDIGNLHAAIREHGSAAHLRKSYGPSPNAHLISVIGEEAFYSEVWAAVENEYHDPDTFTVDRCLAAALEIVADLAAAGSIFWGNVLAGHYAHHNEGLEGEEGEESEGEAGNAGEMMPESLAPAPLEEDGAKPGPLEEDSKEKSNPLDGLSNEESRPKPVQEAPKAPLPAKEPSRPNPLNGPPKEESSPKPKQEAPAPSRDAPNSDPLGSWWVALGVAAAACVVTAIAMDQRGKSRKRRLEEEQRRQEAEWERREAALERKLKALERKQDEQERSRGAPCSEEDIDAMMDRIIRRNRAA